MYTQYLHGEVRMSLHLLVVVDGMFYQGIFGVHLVEGINVFGSSNRAAVASLTRYRALMPACLQVRHVIL